MFSRFERCLTMLLQSIEVPLVYLQPVVHMSTTALYSCLPPPQSCTPWIRPPNHDTCTRMLLVSNSHSQAFHLCIRRHRSPMANHFIVLILSLGLCAPAPNRRTSGYYTDHSRPVGTTSSLPVSRYPSVATHILIELSPRAPCSSLLPVSSELVRFRMTPSTHKQRTKAHATPMQAPSLNQSI